MSNKDAIVDENAIAKPEIVDKELNSKINWKIEMIMVSELIAK